MSEREKHIIDNTTSLIKEYINPSKILLFGSRAKGTNAENSDFDFAVVSSKLDKNLLVKLLDRLEEISGLYTIDLVFLNDVDDEFKKIILNNSIVIYEG